MKEKDQGVKWLNTVFYPKNTEILRIINILSGTIELEFEHGLPQDVNICNFAV